MRRNRCLEVIASKNLYSTYNKEPAITDLLRHWRKIRANASLRSYVYKIYIKFCRDCSAVQFSYFDEYTVKYERRLSARMYFPSKIVKIPTRFDALGG